MMKPFIESVDGFHVRGYRERGNINTPLELAIENGIDRFSLATEAINHVPKRRRIGAPCQGEDP